MTGYFYNLTFANPALLYLLFILLVPIVFYVFRYKKRNAELQLSSLKAFKMKSAGFKPILRHILFAFRIIALALLIIALARPQSSESWEDISTEGIDIMLALDISSSMLARDFDPDRLEASKNLAMEFISGRPYDRIGLVVFAGESFTQCPLTTDHAVLVNLFRDIKSGMIEDGTAIGMGLATSVNRLKESEAKSKVIILLTDGVNNSGDITPITAAEIAETFGVRVYTIGVGSKGMAPYPTQTAFGIRYQNMKVEIDEEILQQIAEDTGGAYFRATDNEKLRSIYNEIDQLEKSKIEVKEYRKKNEEFFWFVVVAGLLIVFEFVVRKTILRSIP